MSKSKYDFGGWATKYETYCSDGKCIKHGAFKHLDGAIVPLVWNHRYDSPSDVIGNVVLKHCDEGVYAFGSFNDNQISNDAKNLVRHGDITSLSIYANKLKLAGPNVMHGEIREVSLVLAGANPGAFIQEVICHGETDATQATIYNDEMGLDLDVVVEHSELQNEPPSDEITHKEETVEDVFNTLSDKQKKAVAIVIDEIVNGGEEESEPEKEKDEEDKEMKHNVFEGKEKENSQEMELKHSEFKAEVLKDARSFGSLKASYEDHIQHAANYGITEIEMLFPEAANVSNEPHMIDRDQTWVGPLLNAVRKSPFAKLKALYADITGDDARALGYVKGNLKKEEVFSLLKRVTSPTTIYKKQKLDRDDIIDIKDFNVVAWMKKEMRGKLDEELARAILVGDGRSSSSPDKIKADFIRPVFNDHDLYTIKKAISNTGDEAKNIIKAVIESREDYEGGGVPNFYTTYSVLTKMLLLEDANGRFIYENVDVLAKTLGVAQIIVVPVMKGLTRDAGDSKTHTVLGIILNPSDYTVGADKGGSVAMFDDFDIDYNQEKYLIETRCSGSLLKPKTAVTIEKVV